MRLTAKAPGKVNLCLLLGGRRPDARHGLVTLLESISLADELELSTPDGLGADLVHCRGVEGPNLAARALAELRARGWTAPPVRVEIRKRVPIAAGMGGGSADAAATLRLAAALAPLPAQIELAGLAAGLGADVPSQLTPGLVLATGAGDVAEPVAHLPPHAFVIVPLAAGLSTQAVYAEADRLGLGRTDAALAHGRDALREALCAGGPLPPELLVNDLEPAALSLCPQIGAALTAIRETGCDHAFVCGSGPTVAGLVWSGGADRPAATVLARVERAAAVLAGRFPGASAAAPIDAGFASVRPGD